MKERHGREDVTIISQEEMLSTLSSILDVLTMAVGALGGISLLVGGVGIVTIMTIAVTERTNEIGLMVALGARRRTILGLFLGEAVALAAIGGAVGLILGIGLAQLIGLFLPALPVHTPLSFVVLAEVLAAAIGLAPGCCRRGAPRCSIRSRRCARNSGSYVSGGAGDGIPCGRRWRHGDPVTIAHNRPLHAARSSRDNGRHENSRNIKLSMLDLVAVREGGTVAEALAISLATARHVEQLGFARYWLAEHHNMPGIASSATAVLVGHIAGGTSRIRVGSGGMMLPNHAPLVVAEAFGTLAELYPGRIDLGLGRAPGTDRLTMRALRRDRIETEDDFPREVAELQRLLGDPQPDQQVIAMPGAGTRVPIWLLGSSLFSAQLAAERGLPYAFASHFAPRLLHQASTIYRERFRPSAVLAEPYVMVGVPLIAAPTDDEAVPRQQRVPARARHPAWRPALPAAAGEGFHGRPASAGARRHCRFPRRRGDRRAGACAPDSMRCCGRRRPTSSSWSAIFSIPNCACVRWTSPPRPSPENDIVRARPLLLVLRPSSGRAPPIR
jgi:luciferase family oxidoreductase group 1